MSGRFPPRTRWIAGIGGGVALLVAVTSIGDLHKALRAASLPEGAHVLPATTAIGMASPCARPRTAAFQGRWTPEASDIAALEARLRGVLERENAPIRFNPARQERQYVGIVRDGRRLILANVFAREALPTVEEELLDRHPEHEPDGFLGREPIFLCDRAGQGFGFEWDTNRRSVFALAVDRGPARHISRYAYDVSAPAVDRPRRD